jgi:hypothetical protein
MRRRCQHIDLEPADIDAKYWREAVVQPDSLVHDVRFDRYRWALRYRQNARHHHGRNLEMNALLKELAEGWSKFGGPSELTLVEARQAIMDSWSHTDTLAADAEANQGGFKSPPTFAQHGARVPRNIDESNT